MVKSCRILAVQDFLSKTNRSFVSWTKLMAELTNEKGFVMNDHFVPIDSWCHSYEFSKMVIGSISLISVGPN